MFIKKEDYNYFEILGKSLDEVRRKKLLDTALKEGAGKTRRR